MIRTGCVYLASDFGGFLAPLAQAVLVGDVRGGFTIIFGVSCVSFHSRVCRAQENTFYCVLCL